MTENKRFTVDGLTITENSQKGRKYLLEYQGGVNALCNRINGLFDKSKRLEEENKELKFQNGELLYQIGEVGKNNKTCRECECFISEIKYCYMWDMEVEADDVVVACDQRKVKNTNEMI